MDAEPSGGFEPPTVDWADGTEYVFDDSVESMERRLANRMERGEKAADLRDEFLASGRSQTDVDAAFVGAHDRLRFRPSEDRRVNRSMFIFRTIMRVLVAIFVIWAIVNVLRSLGVG